MLPPPLLGSIITPPRLIPRAHRQAWFRDQFSSKYSCVFLTPLLCRCVAAAPRRASSLSSPSSSSSSSSSPPSPHLPKGSPTASTFRCFLTPPPLLSNLRRSCFVHLPPTHTSNRALSASPAQAVDGFRSPTQRATKGFLSDSDHLSVTVSAGTPLCPYCVAYRRILR